MTATLTTTSSPVKTVADLLHKLGDIPAERVRLHPSPGFATEQDVIEIDAHEDRLFELVDGTLVEKGMGYLESILGLYIGAQLLAFVQPRKLGYVAGSDGMMRILPGQVRIPDVSFTSLDRLPGGRLPKAPVPEISPDLAVEILSDSNTPREMDRKRREYFESGSRLVWIVDPVERTVKVYTSPEDPVVLDASGTLDGGEVLPGFTMELSPLFALLDD